MYKYSGDYTYSRMVGDYYRGDPFLGGLIRTALPVLFKGAKAVGTKLLGKGAARVAPTLVPALPGAAALTAAAVTRSALQKVPPGMKPVPGLKGKVQRFLPGGATGFFKRRTMNPLNPRALTRATRRLEGFRTKATKALRELGFTVSRVGRGRQPRDRIIRVHESGPGDVNL